MKRSIFLIFFSTLFIATQLSGQDEPIRLANPSFEGTPAAGDAGVKLPDGWYDCGFPGESPPDIHPKDGAGAFQVTKAAFHGKTYLGLVVRDNDTWEMVSQRLSSSLLSGKCYEFSISLARSAVYVSASRMTNEPMNYATPVKLRIWGGTGYCSRMELLAESGLVVNDRWIGFDFRFEPKQTHTYIVLEAFYKTPTPFPYNGNLLIDNASDIIPVPCSVVTPEVSPPIAKSNNGANPPVVKQPRVDTPAVKKPTPSILPELDNPARLTKGQTIRMDKDMLYFPADSSSITSKTIPVLTEVYTFLATNPNIIVEIGGHTNGTPSHEYCDKLSTERAKAIVDYLASKGIPRKRLQYKGYGKRNPIDSNTTAVGRKRNQRVEIKILSTTG